MALSVPASHFLSLGRLSYDRVDPPVTWSLVTHGAEYLGALAPGI